MRVRIFYTNGDYLCLEISRSVSSQSELTAWFDVIHRAVSLLKDDIGLPTPRQSFHEKFHTKQDIPRVLPPLPPRTENDLVQIPNCAPSIPAKDEDSVDRFFSQNPFQSLPLTKSLSEDVSSLIVNITEFSSACTDSLGRLEDMEQRLYHLRQRLV